MTSTATADVIVAGNGVLGLSIAYAAAVRSPGTRVVVVGPAARPDSATTAAGAMLNCFTDVTRFTGVHPASEAKFALARAALDAWPRWLERLEADSDGTAVPRAKGTFVVLGTRATPCMTENYEAVRAAAAKHGEPHEEVDPREIDGLDPLPQERPLHALHLEREGAVDARAVLGLLARAAARHGVTSLDDASPIADLYRRHARQSYDRLGHHVAPAPEILRAVREADDGRVERVATYLRAAPQP